MQIGVEGFNLTWTCATFLTYHIVSVNNQASGKMLCFTNTYFIISFTIVIKMEVRNFQFNTNEIQSAYKKIKKISVYFWNVNFVMYFVFFICDSQPDYRLPFFL